MPIFPTVSTDLGGIDCAYAVAVQPDGKILVAGNTPVVTNSGTSYAAFLARYNTNGSLDTSFSGDGVILTPRTNAYSTFNGLAIESDGKIVVAGIATNASDQFGLARYNSDGTLDTTFSGDGMVAGDQLMPLAPM